MRSLPNLLGTLALLLVCAPALAVEADVKSAKKATNSAALPGLDQRVAEAPMIFVGEGVRVHFIDYQYRERPYIQAAGEGANKSAVVVVKVVKVLHPPNAAAPERVLVPIETNRDVFGEGRSPYDEQVERHVRKQEIWFGEIVVRKDYGDDRTGRRPLEEPVTLLQSGNPKRRLAAAPLNIRYLKQVTEAIARVKGTKAPN